MSAKASPVAATNEAREQKNRRLGRGLSSLLREPVRIEAPSAHEEEEAAAARAGAAAKAREVLHAAEASARPDGGATRRDETAARSASGTSGEDPGARFRQVSVGAIEVGPYQPRQRMDEAGLQGLAASIRSAGVMQPLLVRPLSARGDDGASRFELVAGERRWRAARLAGLERVPAIVVALDDRAAAEWGVVENVQREDLNPIDRARAMRRLQDEFGASAAEVGERLGIDRATVANLVRLCDLEDEAQELIAYGKLSAGHGKALLGAPAGARRVEIAKRAALAGWSVRRLEAAVKGLVRAGGGADGAGANGAASGVDAGAGKDPLALALDPAHRWRLTLVDLEKQLSQHFGTRVSLKTDSTGRRGRVVVEFYDLDQFEGILERMGFKGE